LEVAEPVDLRGISGDDEFAADLMWDRILGTELDHLTDARDGQDRLEGLRPIIQPGVEHSAVVRALVLAGTFFLLPHRDAEFRAVSREIEAGGQSDEASTYDPNSLYIAIRHKGCACVVCWMRPAIVSRARS
jgi:hypothetical protein